MSLGTTTKDPADVVDVTIDWSAFLSDGDSISGTPTWAASPAVPTFSNQSNTANTTRAYITGGVNANSYTISVTITTAKGRTVKRSFTLNVATQ